MEKLIFDTHAHYDDEKFDEDRESFLSGINNDIFSIINCGVDLKSSKMSLEFSKKYPIVYAAVGVHPSEASNASPDFIDKLYNLCNSGGSVVAIGEIGLDYHYDDCDRDVQIDVFKKQLMLANDLSMPVIIHNRDAHEDTLRLLKEYKPKGVIHCFSGSVNMAMDVIKMGMYVGVGGAVTFKNARKIVDVVKNVPLDKILLETDAPYMAPVPNRGKRCDSTMIPITAKKIGDIRGISEKEVLIKTKNNAIKLFLGDYPNQDNVNPNCKNTAKTDSNENHDVITYIFEDNLYVNVTNRCPNRCDFCIRNNGDSVGDAKSLWLKKEPSKLEILEDIKKRNLDAFKELVICGYGEPTMRLSDVLFVCKEIKKISNIKIRMNTNGLSDLINNRSTAADFKDIIDVVSISLNAHNKERYNEICHSRFGVRAFDAIIKFIKDIRHYVPLVYLSVVDFNLSDDDLKSCKKLSEELNVPLRVREYIR